MSKHDDISRRLEAFLTTRTRAEKVKVDGYTPIVGGYSRTMARFTAHIDGDATELIMRADPIDANVTIDSDRDREWALLRWLTEQGGIPMPNALYYDEGGSTLGSKTIILDAVQGQTLLAAIRDKNTVADPVAAYARLAARIHRTDTATLPTEIERPSSWDAYLDRRIEEWREAEARQLDHNPLFRHVAAWLEDNRPEPAPLCLVHGELQPSNIMVDKTGELLAIDWEMTHIGDPREELGWCKWVESMQPPHTITRDEERLCQLYREQSGLDENVVSPSTISYFSIIAGLQPMQSLYLQVKELTEGRNSSLLPAYLLGVLTTAHEHWLQATK